ncbi:MAG TPA: putative zinc-binding metallopeptidase [Thermoanaerobaculia bacterium]|nr:putative zinc-binding metallopeptidase [Thermoanaerobaculia bacterium]
MAAKPPSLPPTAAAAAPGSAGPDFESGKLGPTPIRDLALSLADSPLAPLLDELGRELDNHGIRRLRPHFYLSTEWGVPFGTIAIAIPFYLARPDLTSLHAERTSFVEGIGRSDLLRYLRHEMGHVVNYAYRLYDRADWVRRFGSMSQPYVEEFRPQPFSRRFVRHLPGWYAQKHPDEDWAETFAVWLTPGHDWRADYAAWPEALAKLEYCDRTMAELGDREPLATAVDLDVDVSEVSTALDDFYRDAEPPATDLPPGLDGALRSLFGDLRPDDAGDAGDRGDSRPAAELIRRMGRHLPAEVYRWTGHFPERTRRLLLQLGDRADALRLAYPAARESEAIIAFTTLVTALAMNYVSGGGYAP